MKKLVLLVVLFSCGFLFSQQFTWTKSFGGIKNDNGYFLKKIKNNGFFVVGVVSNSSDDIQVIKLDDNSNVEWQKNIGGSKDEGISYSKNVIVDDDGNLVMVLYSYSNDGDFLESVSSGRSIWVVKLDQQGNLLNKKRFDLPPVSYDREVYSIDSFPTGYVLTTYIDEKSYLLFTDKNCNWIDSKFYKSTTIGGTLVYNDVVAISDGFLLVGTLDFSGYKYATQIAKINFSGDVIWTSSFGNDASYYKASHIVANDDGTFAIAGNAGGTLLRPFVAKYNSLGNQMWIKVLTTNMTNDTYNGNDNLYDFMINSNNEYVTAGSARYAFSFARLNWNGDLLGRIFFKGNDDSYANSVIQLDDQSYVMVGTSKATKYLYTNTPIFNNLGPAGTSDIVMAGFNNIDFSLSTNENLGQQLKTSVYPNPVVNEVFVQSKNQNIKSYQIITEDGKLVLQNEHIRIEKINISNLKVGIYYLILKDANGSQYTHKIIKQ
ncbi:Por secretion system C-terminal sorting domain-containing protein [Soonwooa buanensis]|uniref:Por secretion system C-terminal sorting domain-containing protein n=1 Tax=Soonwooa buanensis TaxID=619805 RepID=A0A1T5EV86_9FLAO|nr:T9SS type A sorting domain-containing protein [Soonwooa buanensis]SKB87729.1 Por secretion system C-terminal sorting domain-containing protein [Soonwooa buanensis]